MRNAKALLCAAMFMAVGAGMWSALGTTSAAAEPKEPVANHWRHHDGHWNYWHDGDQRWYYTDGTNWFYNNGVDNSNTWNVYGFDKQFGKEGFEKGEYKVPGNGTKIETPKHAYYHPGK